MKRVVFAGLVFALLLTLVAPVLTVSAAPETGACQKIHKVKKGQTLSGIAWRYGVTVKALKKANGIKRANLIYPGQRLCIPGYYPPPAKPKPTPSYYPPPPQPGDPPESCGIPVVLGFGDLYMRNAEVRQRLGCPLAAEDGFTANEQQFKSGYVIQNTDAKEIYVLFNTDNYWETQPDTWQEGDPIDNPTLVPPQGWHQPTYGIGKMWRNVDNYSQRLGWAKAPQDAVTATHQAFEHGWMIWTASQGIFVLYDNNSWQHYN